MALVKLDKLMIGRPVIDFAELGYCYLSLVSDTTMDMNIDPPSDGQRDRKSVNIEVT